MNYKQEIVARKVQGIELIVGELKEGKHPNTPTHITFDNEEVYRVLYTTYFDVIVLYF